MLTITPDRATQIALDFETDNARRERNDWQNAIDSNLHAIRDYVDSSQAIVWRPGIRKRGPGTAGYGAFNVHLATNDSCTCQTFKLNERCEHVAFVRRIEALGIELGQDNTVKAIDINDSTVIKNGELT